MSCFISVTLFNCNPEKQTMYCWPVYVCFKFLLSEYLCLAVFVHCLMHLNHCSMCFLRSILELQSPDGKNSRLMTLGHIFVATCIASNMLCIKGCRQAHGFTVHSLSSCGCLLYIALVLHICMTYVYIVHQPPKRFKQFNVRSCSEPSYFYTQLTII